MGVALPRAFQGWSDPERACLLPGDHPGVKVARIPDLHQRWGRSARSRPISISALSPANYRRRPRNDYPPNQRAISTSKAVDTPPSQASRRYTGALREGEVPRSSTEVGRGHWWGAGNASSGSSGIDSCCTPSAPPCPENRTAVPLAA